METIEYRFANKTAWGTGPWQSEPDKKQWTDETTGLPCLIVRGPMGALCGYVGVAEGHPAFGMDYSHWGWDSENNEPKRLTALEEQIDSISVHGGLTFANRCAEGEPDHGICHRPTQGEPDHVWWFGFDCAHSGDLIPKWERHDIFQGDVYRDQAYVEAECAGLAQQLFAVA